MDRLDSALGQLLVLVVVVLAAKWLLGYIQRKRAAKTDQPTTTDKVLGAVAHTLEPDKGEIGDAVKKWLIPTVIVVLSLLFLSAIFIAVIGGVMGTY